MAGAKTPRFSARTLSFLEKASRQKRPDWLERNQPEYEQVLLAPLLRLAQTVARELGPLAPDYHFPLKGIGRLKRPAHRVAEHGGGLYKDWISYSAARPRVSRFEHNPNLFFLINPEDSADPVLVAGGLYMPSSAQVRKIREALATDASAFDRLFATKDFSRRFPGGFSREKSSSRPPRGFDPNHERIAWLRLQAFFVWRPYRKKEFYSVEFPFRVASDFKLILRMNRLLEAVLSGSAPARAAQPARRRASLLESLTELEPAKRQMDF